MTTSKIPEIFHIKPNIKMALYSWFALKKKQFSSIHQGLFFLFTLLKKRSDLRQKQ
jgi:hypothetical protein